MKRKIKQEKILLEYLRIRLLNGITDGVNEVDYFTVADGLIKSFNTDKSADIRFKEEKFSDIGYNAENLTRGLYNKMQTGVIFKNNIISPTYNLRRYDFINNRILLNNTHEKIMSEYFANLIKPLELSTYSFTTSEHNYKEAEKIAAVFINELINRYLKDVIKKGVWPNKFNDADKYIFDSNIGLHLKEKGTKEIFLLAYMNAIRTVLELKEENNIPIGFSNNPTYPLAYANYLKMIIPNELAFLTKYHYSGLNKGIDVTTHNTTNYSKYHNLFPFIPCEWTKYYDFSNFIDSEGEYSIMKKRLS